MPPIPRFVSTTSAISAPAVAGVSLLLIADAVTPAWALLAILVAVCMAGTFGWWVARPSAAADQTSASTIRSHRAGDGSDAAVLELLHDPVILLDGERRVVRANRAARDLLGTHLVGRDLAAALRHPQVLNAVDAALSGAPERVVQFTSPGNVERIFVARVTAFDGHPHGAGAERNESDRVAAIIALRDITALKRSEQMRDDFVANVSHELRTPLSSLVGFIETIRGPARDDPDAQERFLLIMQDQAARMARLVTDLLSLSRIEQNEHTPPTGRVDIAALAAGVAAALELRARSRGMEIRLELPDSLPPVVGDADELVQLFQNLIDNAVKYGREGTAVRVSAEVLPVASGPSRGVPMVSVAVRDRGDGIAREHLPRLTERFYRADAARSRSLGGTGLGLAIVKHVVNRHRGRLNIHSEIGEGSTFTVQLPTASPDGEVAGLDRMSAD